MPDTPCTYRISVKAIVKDSDGRILLLGEKDGSWDLLGGGLEQGEDPKEALKREVSEETGLIVDSISDQPVDFWTLTREGSDTIKWFGFVAYEVRVSGEFKVQDRNDEAHEVKFFSPEEARQLNLHPNTKPYFAEV